MTDKYQGVNMKQSYAEFKAYVEQVAERAPKEVTESFKRELQEKRNPAKNWMSNGGGGGMREYIFRGKDKTGKWVYSQNVDLRPGFVNGRLYVYFYINGRCVMVDAKTVGQYTGRKDKKEQAIYEGDILHREVAFPGKSGDYYYVVKPIDDYLEKGETYGIFSVHLWESECEVIGNVHDNPELVVE